MLIALFALLFFSGKSDLPILMDDLKDLQKAVNSQIEDPVLQEASVQMIKDLRELTKDYKKDRDKLAKELIEFLVKHENSLADAEHIMSVHRDQEAAFQEDLVDGLLALRAGLSPEEWEGVSPWAEAAADDTDD